MNERDEPMKGLADWLRGMANTAYFFQGGGMAGSAYIYQSGGYADTLHRWASEVEASRQRSAVGAEPIDMLLFCPKCGTQHIDAPETTWKEALEATGRQVPPEAEVAHANKWTNPPHKSHLCRYCKTIWRPADVPTNGIACGITRGKADTWLVGDGAAPSERPAAPAQAERASMEDFEVNEITGSVNGQLQDYSRLAPAQAGVTDAQAVLTELVACVDGDCSTPEELFYWEKREAAAWDRARSLLAGTPAQSDGDT